MHESWIYFCQACWTKLNVQQSGTIEVRDASQSGFSCSDVRFPDGTLLMAGLLYPEVMRGDSFLGVLGADGKLRRGEPSARIACGRPATKVLVMRRASKDAASVDQAVDEHLGVSSQLSVDEFFSRLLRSERQPDDDADEK